MIRFLIDLTLLILFGRAPCSANIIHCETPTDDDERRHIT